MLNKIIHKRPRVLVVDDEDFNRRLLSRILGENYTVDFAVNGQDVLEKLDHQNYDTILLDVMMPIMNGIDTLKIIRQNTNLTDLPIILVSALSDHETIVAGIEFGANDYITKPIDSGIVLARLHTQVMLKRLMDERKSANVALSNANKMMLRMMQIASHDLKNPLSNLSMLTSVINGLNLQNEQMPDLMDIAHQSIGTMVKIIDDFLSGEAFVGDEDIPVQSLSSIDLLEDILKQHELAAKEKNITIEVHHLEHTNILVDETRLKQVLTNLISNAIKYSPCDSFVAIRAFQQDLMWRLEIQDSGPGIPKNERQYLFQAFSKNQISTKPTDGESSTGLGLWIAAEMMRIQNGTIGMDSPLEGGCCFWIEVPLAEEPVSV